ncbi:MAG: glycosyltransferase [Ferruginibacter sp.]
MNIKSNINKKTDFKVLVAPLDWGLGHATRCIPIIRSLINNGAEVLLAAEKETKLLLSKEFPDLIILNIEGYRVKYQKSGSFAIKLFTQIPGIISSIKKEKNWLSEVIKKHKIDIVISDNRYGLNNKMVHCIFITHQLSILTGNKLLDKILQKINYRFISKFNECWIPDVKENNNLSGLLSHPKKLPDTKIKYVGVLSRFIKLHSNIKNNFLFLISGPEPQRTIFEEQLIKVSKNILGNKIFVRGVPNSDELKINDETLFYNHLPAEKLNQLISESEIIVCRSGYSTIMDLSATGKKAILIPTPGQKEQEYLAKYLGNKNGFIFLQSLDNINGAIETIKGKDYPNEVSSFIEDAVVNLLREQTILK